LTMDLKLGLLADFANKSADGKLNILGVFDRIWAQQFPAVHQEMKLVLRFAAHAAEIDEPKKIKIRLVTDVGAPILELEGEMRLHRPPDLPPGELISADQILALNGLPLPEAGRYEFVIMVNGEVKGTVPVTVAVRRAPPGPRETEETGDDSR
jgi:Family of unknown function (DUF6941)